MPRPFACSLEPVAFAGSLFGAVCPARATGAALVMRYANTEAMNAHLVEISRHVTPGAHARLVLDGAGWHTSKSLVVPENITVMPRSWGKRFAGPFSHPSNPCSPELNPVETLWQHL